MSGYPAIGDVRERAPRLPPAGLVGLAALAAACFGAALATHPVEAALLLCLIPLALGAPTASLAVVLFVTVLVPFDLQNRVSIGGGSGVPGLLVVDVLLGLGLCRIAALVLVRRLRVTTPLLVAGALLVVLTAAMVHGLAGGADASAAGTEARCMVLGIGAFILALPLFEDRVARRRLFAVLVALGLVLGLWGLAQVVFGISYGAGGDIGVRPGIDQISAVEGGQLQGGLFAFPLAVILSFGALLSIPVRSGPRHALVATVLVLDSACVLLTFERTIWGAAAIGCAVVALRAGPRAWAAAGGWLAIGAAGIVAATALSPGALSTASGRVTSVFSYRTDNSIQARTVESAAVLRAIRRHPAEGAGFGATITWGKQDVYETRTTGFSHNGYLWLAWKAGIAVTLSVVLALAVVALRRRRVNGDAAFAAFLLGAQAALLAVLLMGVTFPTFNTLGLTALVGTLAAGCLAAGDRRGRAR